MVQGIAVATLVARLHQDGEEVVNKAIPNHQTLVTLFKQSHVPYFASMNEGGPPSQWATTDQKTKHLKAWPHLQTKAAAPKGENAVPDTKKVPTPWTKGDSPVNCRLCGKTHPYPFCRKPAGNSTPAVNKERVNGEARKPAATQAPTDQGKPGSKGSG